MATIKSYTSLEQSRRLAEILSLESADMWFANGIIVARNSVNEPDDIKSLFPCWSLAALLCVIKEQGLVDLRFLQSTYDNRGNRLTNVWCCTFENLGTISLDLYADNPIDACVAMIEKLNELNLL